MATAALALALDPPVERRPMRSCLFLRFSCRKCGQYEIAMVYRKNVPEQYLNACASCGGAVLLTAKAIGKTAQELPHITTAKRRSFCPYWLQNATLSGRKRNTQGGNKPGGKWRDNPSREPERN